MTTNKNDLQFIKANATIPHGAIFSTARRGDKWWQQAKIGDVMNCVITESGQHFAQAVVVDKRLDTFGKVVANCIADNNHALPHDRSKLSDAEASAALERGLKAAYGADLTPTEPFTVLKLVALNTDSQTPQASA